MTSLGVHFALTSEQTDKLFDAEDAGEVMAFIEELEENADDGETMDTDKSWDAIHRCLGDGTLDPDGTYPLAYAILGGKQIDTGEDYYIVSYATAEQVADIAPALAQVDKQWFRTRYLELDPQEYAGPHDEEDFDYTWENFVEVRDFYAYAASVGRSVIFTVDQ